MSNLISNDNAPHSRWSFSLDFGFAIMLFGYELEAHFDLFDWHFQSSDALPAFMFLWAGPFYFGLTDTTIHNLDFDEKDTKIAQLTKDLKGAEFRLAFEKDETEQLRVKLDGCAAAAGGYGENLKPRTYGHSKPYDEVRLLYVKYRQALKLIEKIRGKKEPPKRSHKAKKAQ